MPRSPSPAASPAAVAVVGSSDRRDSINTPADDPAAISSATARRRNLGSWGAVAGPAERPISPESPKAAQIDNGGRQGMI